MYTKTVTSELIKKDIQERLSESSSLLNNTSKSSTTSQIVDAIAEPLSKQVDYFNGLINSLYTDLASDELLTANAYEFGVIRNMFSEVFVRNSDKSMMIYMKDGSAFPDYMKSKVVIPQGAEFVINNSAKLRITENIVVTPGDYSQYISAKVVAPAGADIPAGTSISVEDKNIPITNGMSIKVSLPISFKMTTEDDDSLRRRTQLAKIKMHGSSEYSIASWVLSIPTITDYKMVYNNGNGAYNIYIMTSNYASYGVDPNSDSVISTLKEKFDGYIGAENKINVEYPYVYNASFVLSYSNSTEDTVKAALVDAYNKIYSFGNTEKINVGDIRTLLLNYPGEIQLEAITLSSALYGVIGIYKNEEDITIPSDGVFILSTENSYFINRDD